MNLTEKAAYLQGLAEGMDLGDSKEGRLIRELISMVSEMATYINDVDETVMELGDELDELYDAIAELEDEAEDFEDEDGDEDLYEITCPACEATFEVDEETLLDGGIACPSCGEPLEFDIECDCDDDCDCDCCEEEE